MKGPITGLDIGHVSKKKMKKLLKKRRRQHKKEQKLWRKEIRKRRRRIEKKEYERTHVTLKGKKIRWRRCPQPGCNNRVQVIRKSDKVHACWLCLLRLALGRNKDRFDDHTPTQRRKAKEWYETQHPKYKKFKKNLKKRQKQLAKQKKRAEYLRAQRTMRKQRDNFMLIVKHRTEQLKREFRDA
jgi:hypothetical protein